jgi:hypothetical protein
VANLPNYKNFGLASEPLGEQTARLGDPHFSLTSYCMLGDHGSTRQNPFWRGSLCNTLMSESLRPIISQENNR